MNEENKTMREGEGEAEPRGKSVSAGGLRSSGIAKFAAFVLCTIIPTATFWTGLYAALPGDVDRLFEISQPWGYSSVTSANMQPGLALVLAAAGLLITIALIVFLLSASGHHRGAESIEPGWGTAVPLEITLAAAFGLGVFPIYLMMENFYYIDFDNEPEVFFVLWSLIGMLLAALSLGVLMSLAVRIKLGGWWKNTVCFMLICLIWKAVKWLWSLLIRILGALLRGIRKVFGFFRDLIRGIPTIWKGMLVIAGVSFAELLLYESFRWDGEWVFVAWFVLHLITIPAGMYILLMDLRLKKGADALAAGDLSHQIESKYMISDYRAHAKSLNSIGEGLARAVEQRTKSERFRTELITNVSHDIKTPLTSIINYSELIGKVLDAAENGEETDTSGEADVDTEKLREYSGVLGRQSDKLKRLLDDLVEASKASTGNLDVQLAPCDAAVFVDQAEGEYSEKLGAAGLALITSKPQTPVRIMADGRRMWRVFDNLINNACKYSQPGTRVYLSLETGGQEAVFTLRSTSREPLNISADELMERFVRGDRSRSSEGSGLGLSIARSLTELQKGSFGIAVDGDLFKAVLRFPLL